jgi:hypothetical protein
MMAWLTTSPEQREQPMAAYSLTATHSLTNDRARVRDVGVIQLRCTLTVYLLILQPIVDALLESPFRVRRQRTISIHDITSRENLYGFEAKTWHFTIRLQTGKKNVRTRTWWGRQLPASQLRELPFQILERFELRLNRSLRKLTRSDFVSPQSDNALTILP